MRVIAGEAKGRRLKSPKNSSTRPTTALVRGAIFSSLQVMAEDWSRVLDLYAGSGALGIEALSQGADHVDFVEHNPKCCAIIKENLQITGYTAQGKVYCCLVNKALTVLNGVYSIVLIDAPYSELALVDIIGDVLRSKLVDADSTIVVQHSSHQPLPEELNRFRIIRNRHYGETWLSVYRQEEMN